MDQQSAPPQPPPPSGSVSPCRFVKQVLLGRWFMMFASFLIMAGAGATYLFGVYSKVIKSTLGYDQSTLNLLGSFKDLGANVGVLSGLIAEVTPTWFVLLIGSAMNFAGYFMIWLAVTKKISKPSVWQMCMYICMGANSQNFANTGSLVTCVKNFPESRGMLIGLMKGFIGLSGAVFTQLYLAIYGNDAESLILLIGWLPAVISILFVFNIRTMKISRHPNEVKVFYEYLIISVSLALCLMGLTIAQNVPEEFTTLRLKEQAARAGLSRLVVVEEEPPLVSSKPEPEIVEVPGGLKCEDHEKRDACCCTNICNKPKRGEDYSILQALLSVDMLILFVSTFCGLGCSLTAVDNLGQIGESLGYPQRTISTFVSLVSIWNYFGFSYGVQLTLLFIIISELFGLKYYSTLFNCGQLASPLGSYILNVRIVGKLYDREALKQLTRRGMTRSMVHELTCIGKDCYRLSFLILAGVNLFGALVSLILVMRTREYYRTDIYKRFRDEMEANEKEVVMMKTIDDASDKKQSS
ncbi:UNVERIFIED_CONTAM: hypothetical protein Scaly_0557400 [Sesamum calycinum]|uniref:Nodulin-like domain-containing protein n=1 Tax=Sesamum calycinum TaxID=2727403 RepID=A0AAW2RR85_9LAMI